MNCPQHPENVEAAAKMARSGNRQPMSLPIRSRNKNPQQRVDVQYQVIDHSQTRERNRLDDERRQNNIQYLRRGQPNDETPLISDNRSHSQEDLDRTYRPRIASKNDLYF